jgi:hypothetical protein
MVGDTVSPSPDVAAVAETARALANSLHKKV